MAEIATTFFWQNPQNNPCNVLGVHVIINYIQMRGANYIMKKFIYKHILKPNPDITATEIGTLAALIWVAFLIVAAVTLTQMKYDWQHRIEQVDMCRIESFIINDDYTKTYFCKSQKTNELLAIHEYESEQIKHNAYINRPVKIFADGSVK